MKMFLNNKKGHFYRGITGRDFEILDNEFLINWGTHNVSIGTQV